MAGQTARAARLGFGQGFDVGERIANRKLRERSQRFSESLSLRAEGRQERSIALQEQRLALQQQEFANRTLSTTEINAFKKTLQNRILATQDSDFTDGTLSRDSFRSSVAESLTELFGNRQLGSNERANIDAIVNGMEADGRVIIPGGAKGDIEIPLQSQTQVQLANIKKFRERQARGETSAAFTPAETFGETATQVADDFLAAPPAFQGQNTGDRQPTVRRFSGIGQPAIDPVFGEQARGTFGSQDFSQFTDDDLQGVIDQDVAFPSRTVSAPDPRDEQAVRGGSFR